MRDPERIYKFCAELANLWHDEVPDWRFGQFVSNVVQSEREDIFFIEDDKMIERIKEALGVK